MPTRKQLCVLAGSWLMVLVLSGAASAFQQAKEPPVRQKAQEQKAREQQNVPPAAQDRKVEEPKIPNQQPASAKAKKTGDPDSLKPIVFAAVGDIMLGSSYPNEQGLPVDDGEGLLEEVAPIISAADVAFGNLEGPMIDGGKTTKCAPDSKRCYAFRVPTRYGRYLSAAGFDVMSLANNHALDFGIEGRNSSKRVLNQQGIAHSGEVGDIARLKINGKEISIVAFSNYDSSHNMNDIDAAVRIVTRLAATGNLVVVSFHGGAEGARYQHVAVGTEMFAGENRGDLRRFAHAVIDAGADLVLGHGPHVVRGMEVYRDRLIAYSLGNFATYGGFNLTGPLGLSLILEVELSAEGRFLCGRIHPVRQEKPGGPLLDPDRAIIPIVRQLSDEDFGSNAVMIDELGKISPPAREPVPHR